jgi:uncharacterized protein (DUF983 family)
MSRHPNDDRPTLIALLSIAALLVSVGIWARVSAPCSAWSWAPVKDVPARCLMHR